MSDPKLYFDAYHNANGKLARIAKAAATTGLTVVGAGMAGAVSYGGWRLFEAGPAAGGLIKAFCYTVGLTTGLGAGLVALATAATGLRFAKAFLKNEF